MTGEITFGAPQYENEYTYNGESYNPNIESQYLRARYYNVVTASFLTEDSYLGDINEPLTLNRYNYCVSSYLNYQDPSGNYTPEQGRKAHEALQKEFKKRFAMTPYTAYAPYYISKGYEYSNTGMGFADMVLEHPNRALEVYEIKSGYNNIAKNTRDIALQAGKVAPKINYLIGYDQRMAYENALREEFGRTVIRATSFSPYGLELPIEDDEYQYAVYYSYPDQPGMIYYWLKKGGPSAKPLPQTVKVTEEKCNVRECLNKVIEYGEIMVDITIAVEAGKQMLTTINTILDKQLLRIFPFLIIPDEMIQPVYPIGEENYELQCY